jgi:hypothetical protein
MPPNPAIRYVAHADIDRLRWDDAITRAANSLPYAYSWYLDIVAPHWDALVTDDYSAVMPLTWKYKWGIYYLYQPFFAQQLGIFALVPPTAVLVNAFLQAIPPRFRYCDFYLNYANQCPIQAPFAAQARCNYVLSLNDKYEQLFLSYRPNMRGHLKKAQRSPFQVTTNVSTDEVVQLFRTATGVKIDNLAPPHYDRLALLARTCQQHNSAETYGVYDENQTLVAAIFFIKTPRRLINLVSTGTQRARTDNLTIKIIDHVVRQYAQSDMVLDFEGSMIEAIATFYRGFGAQETHYWHITYDRMPLAWRWLKRWRKAMPAF